MTMKIEVIDGYFYYPGKGGQNSYSVGFLSALLVDPEVDIQVKTAARLYMTHMKNFEVPNMLYDSNVLRWYDLKANPNASIEIFIQTCRGRVNERTT